MSGFSQENSLIYLQTRVQQGPESPPCSSGAAEELYSILTAAKSSIADKPYVLHIPAATNSVLKDTLLAIAADPDVYKKYPTLDTWESNPIFQIATENLQHLLDHNHFEPPSWLQGKTRPGSKEELVSIKALEKNEGPRSFLASFSDSAAHLCFLAMLNTKLIQCYKKKFGKFITIHYGRSNPYIPTQSPCYRENDQLFFDSGHILACQSIKCCAYLLDGHLKFFQIEIVTDGVGLSPLMQDHPTKKLPILNFLLFRQSEPSRLDENIFINQRKHNETGVLKIPVENLHEPEPLSGTSFIELPVDVFEITLGSEHQQVDPSILAEWMHHSETFKRLAKVYQKRLGISDEQARKDLQDISTDISEEYPTLLYPGRQKS